MLQVLEDKKIMLNNLSIAHFSEACLDFQILESFIAEVNLN